MKKPFASLILFTIVLMLASSSSATLLTSGDFTGVILQYPASGFSVDTGVYNTWLAAGPTGNQTTTNGQWKVASSGGPSGAGDYWAQHYTESGGIFQGIAGVIYNDSPPSFGGIISTERSRYWNVSRKRF